MRRGRLFADWIYAGVAVGVLVIVLAPAVIVALAMLGGAS